MRIIARVALALAAIASASPAFADGDPAAGKIVFNKCLLCHVIVPGGKKIGPSLWGVVGRPSGTLAGFNYSPAMAAYHHVWTPENLDVYLTAPMKVVVGTRMTFAGLSNPTDRQNVIAYLSTLK